MNPTTTDATISFAVGYFLPLLVALITKETTFPAIKSIALAILSGISGVLTQWLNSDQNHTAFHWQIAVTTALITFAIGAASHTSLWSNTKIRKVLQDFGASPSGTPVVTSLPANNATPAGSGSESI